MAGEGKKSEILGGPAEGGPVEGGSVGMWSKEVQTSNNHNKQPQQRQTQNKWGPEGPAHQQHTTTQHNNNNNNTSKFGQNTKTLKLAKVDLAKVGQDHDWPKLVWPKSVWPKSVSAGMALNSGHNSTRRPLREGRKK